MHYKIEEIVEMAICVSIAIILDKFARFSISPSGGSINISLLPLMIYSLRHGPMKGFIAIGIIYGLITCLIDGYGFITYPLDYLLGFGVFGIIGCVQLKKEDFASHLKISIIIILCGLFRLLCSSINSILIYGYKFIPAIIYNITYIGPTIIVDVIIMNAIYPFLIKISKRFKTQHIEKGRI